MRLRIKRGVFPVTAAGLLLSGSVGAVAVTIGYESAYSEVRFTESNLADPSTPRTRDLSVPLDAGVWRAGLEAASPIWGGFEAGLVAGVPLGTLTTGFDLSKTEIASTMYENSRLGDSMSVDIRAFPVFLAIGWHADVGRHRVRLSGGLGAMVVSAVTTTRDQWWTNGSWSNPDPNAFAVPGSGTAGPVATTIRTQVAVVRSLRFAMGWDYAVLPSLRVGVEGTVVPLPTTVLSGTTGEPRVFGIQDPGLAYGRTAYGISIRVSGTI